MTDTYRHRPRVHPDFEKTIKNIARERVLKGKDDPLKPKSFTRLTLALIRHPSFPNLKEDMVRLDIPDEPRISKRMRMNGRGQISYILIVALIAVIMLPILALALYASGILTTALHDVPDTPLVNISDIADITVGNVNAGLQQLKFWSYMVILFMFIGILIANALVRAHPGWFFPYVLIVGIIAFISIFLSRAYESILTTGGLLADQLNSGFSGSNWLIVNLPLVVTVMGIVGGMFMFIPFNRDEYGGGF